MSKNKNRKTHNKSNTRKYKNRRFTRRFRKRMMRGGTSFPASISNNDIASSPQSYLPFNDFSNDPGYNVIGARNTGPFLTGVSGGSKKRGRSNRKMHGGGVSASISNGLNNLSNSFNVMPHSLNETTGVSGVALGTINQFSGTGSAYSSSPVNNVPLA